MRAVIIMIALRDSIRKIGMPRLSLTYRRIFLFLFSLLYMLVIYERDKDDLQNITSSPCPFERLGRLCPLCVIRFSRDQVQWLKYIHVCEKKLKSVYLIDDADKLKLSALTDCFRDHCLHSRTTVSLTKSFHGSVESRTSRSLVHHVNSSDPYIDLNASSISRTSRGIVLNQETSID